MDAVERDVGDDRAYAVATDFERAPLDLAGWPAWQLHRYTRQMSGSSKEQRAITVEEYLRLEAESAVRHEYVGGERYALAGSSTRHNLIAGNLLVHLRAAARGRSCRVYMSDVKLRAGSAFYYPDVMIDCAPGEPPALVIQSPCVVIEVSSPSTALIDRREKLAAYRSLPSLRAYLIVDQDRRHVTRHWRDVDGTWVHASVTEHERIPVPCVETELRLEAIYENVAIPPLGVAEPVEEAV